jgi:deoxyribonuclease-4
VSESSTKLIKFLREYEKTGQKCVQIFFGDAKSLNRRKLTKDDEDECRAFIKEKNIAFVTHFPYSFNMCNAELNMGPLQAELKRVGSIGGRVVLHTGSCTFSSYENRKVKNAGVAVREAWKKDWQKGADILIEHLRGLDYEGLSEYPLLLEPPAGEGKKLGWTFEQLKYIFARVPVQVGFCLDTCHAFAAGMCRFDTTESITELMENLHASLGKIERFKLIHLNDSQDEFGAMKDRHEILQQGKIWQDEKNREGLLALWATAHAYGVDVVSEVGTLDDAKVMEGLDEQLKAMLVE